MREPAGDGLLRGGEEGDGVDVHVGCEVGEGRAEDVRWVGRLVPGVGVVDHQGRDVEGGFDGGEDPGEDGGVGEVGGEDEVGGGVDGGGGVAGDGGDSVGEGFEFVESGEADVGAGAEEEEDFGGHDGWVVRCLELGVGGWWEGKGGFIPWRRDTRELWSAVDQSKHLFGKQLS